MTNPIRHLQRWTKSQTRKLLLRLGYTLQRVDSSFASSVPERDRQSLNRASFKGKGLLQGDVALITGAAWGIGAAIARALADEGAQTFLTDLAEDEIRNIALEIAGPKSSSAFLAADLRDLASYDKIVDAAINRFGSVSIMVHAASPRTPGSIFELDGLVNNENLVVNLEAGYQLAKRVSRMMIRDSIKGRLLFITSLHARTPRGNPAYSAAKASVTAMMMELAKALGPHGIRANAIAPGIIVRHQSKWADETFRSTALRRLGTPDEVAKTAVALLSDYTSYVTGTTLTVDGGLSLHNWIDT